MRYFLCLMLLHAFSFLSSDLKAQDNQIPYLMGILKKGKEDTNTLHSLSELSRIYQLKGKNDSTEFYCRKTFELADALIPMAEGRNLNSIKLEKSRAYQILGNLYFSKGDYTTALSNQLEALRILEEINHQNGIANSYNNIGNIFTRRGNHIEAYRYYVKAMKSFEELGNKPRMADCYNNIGTNHLYEGKFDDALKNYLIALKLRKEIGNKTDIASSYSNLGAIYEKLGRLREAMESQKQALEIGEELKDKNLVAYALSNIGSVYHEMGEYSSSVEWQKRAIDMGKEIHDKELLKYSYSFIRNSLEKLHNYKEALEYEKLFHELKDSLINEKNTAATAEIMTRYQTEKKDQEIALLNSENSRNKTTKYAAISIAIVVITASIIGFNNIRVKNRASQLARTNEVRQKISRDLHDEIGIGLTSIFMICDKEIRKTSDKEDHKYKALNEVKSQVINVSNKLRELVWSTRPENDNIRALSSYLREYIYHLFENSDITLSLEIPDDVVAIPLSADVGRNLLMVIKESLNNCIKHSGANHLHFRLGFTESNKYKIQISDNGKGFDYQSIYERQGGLSNMRKRIESIQGNFSLISEKGVGTKINIEGSF